MATTPEASDADLRNRLRGEPGVTPEDTRSELLQDGQDKVLRDNLRGVPGVAPEDTHSELLAEKAKEERKAQEADSMRQEREATAALGLKSKPRRELPATWPTIPTWWPLASAVKAIRSTCVATWPCKPRSTQRMTRH